MTINAFISDLDGRWQIDGLEKTVLKLIGSAALMLQSSYARITKDADVLQVEPLTPELCDRLEKLAGRGSELDRRHNMYLEFVSPGLPFLPKTPNWLDLPDQPQRHPVVPPPPPGALNSPQARQALRLLHRRQALQRLHHRLAAPGKCAVE